MLRAKLDGGNRCIQDEANFWRSVSEISEKSRATDIVANSYELQFNLDEVGETAGSEPPLLHDRLRLVACGFGIHPPLAPVQRMVAQFCAANWARTRIGSPLYGESHSLLAQAEGFACGRARMA